MMNESYEHAPDLFAREKTVLNKAIQAQANSSSSAAHSALSELIHEYERVIRDMRRVISHSDRTELELSIANQRLRELTEALTFQNRHDGLTRLLNRTTLIREAEQLLKTTDTALIMIDIDHFKQINDRYGHPTGDKVLIGLAETLRSTTQAPVLCGRLGGEEFAIVTPTNQLDSVVDLGEKISEEIRNLRVEHEVGLRVTASLSITLAEPGVSFDTLYLCGDDALYRAKHDGRNRIEVVPHPLTLA
jgi:diguanylate cyclase (GGDEF)-like protein